jgi:integrase/recombinase XerD
MLLRVVKSNGNQDQYVVLSKTLLGGLRRYFQSYKPKEYLFNSREKGKPLGSSAVQQTFRLYPKKSRK